jgi:hypothetical protein
VRACGLALVTQGCKRGGGLAVQEGRVASSVTGEDHHEVAAWP